MKTFDHHHSVGYRSATLASHTHLSLGLEHLRDGFERVSYRRDTSVMNTIQKILFLTDFSRSAQIALDYAIQFTGLDKSLKIFKKHHVFCFFFLAEGNKTLLRISR